MDRLNFVPFGLVYVSLIVVLAKFESRNNFIIAALLLTTFRLVMSVNQAAFKLAPAVMAKITQSLEA